jgi:hypothetical protein
VRNRQWTGVHEPTADMRVGATEKVEHTGLRSSTAARLLPCALWILAAGWETHVYACVLRPCLCQGTDASAPVA